MPSVIRYLLTIALLLPLGAAAQPTRSATDTRARIRFTVRDGAGAPLAYAVVSMRSLDPASAGERPVASTTDAAGGCSFTLRAGEYEAVVSYVGYTTRRLRLRLAAGGEATQQVQLRAETTQIGEVVITGSQVQGPVSTMRIGREAMQHLQPSSFEDLLELLPGGRASDPAFSSSNHIRLREVPTSSSDYATSALGVSFVMDGIPLSNDAAMQYQTAMTGIGDRVSLNAGIDMRTLSTDEIASVDIVQGIPSVEYGDLTSGLVKIRRKEGGRNLEARFKADLKSQLLYLGKGFEWGAAAERLTMNVGFNYLDARADPRNTRQNYRRLSASWRIKKHGENDAFHTSLGGSLDYTSSFDRVKSDTDIDFGPTGIPRERYGASYNNTVAALNFSVQAKERHALFRSFEFASSLSYQSDRIDRWRYVTASANVPIRTSLQEGVYDAEILPARYEATLRVDGRPFYASAKGTARFGFETEHAQHTLRAGAEWNMSKNYGGGLLYDVARPFSETMSTRPRRYDALPALHRISAFAEDHTEIRTGGWLLDLMAGLRTTTTANIGSRYALQGRFYFDPRLNLSVSFPAFGLGGRPLRLTLAGGTGWHTKMPTLDQLFPDPVYFDYTQLNYFPADESQRRINLVVYRYDPTNYALKPARNFKWELRLRADWAGYSLSATWFRERMSSGFRTSTRVLNYTHRNYDETQIDASTLTGPPSLEGLPYTEETELQTVGYTGNGSRTVKRGVEFTLSTPRIRPLATKLIVSGAWFRTDYSNSEPQYIYTSTVINDRPYPYIGLYDDEDRFYNEVSNTNFLFDTQLPRLGLIFSTSFQVQWFYARHQQPRDPRPKSYLDTSLQEHPFTEASAADGVLRQMIRTVSDIAYRYDRTPWSMYVNLKISKRLYRDRITAAVFVNRLFDCSPSYHDSTGGLRRRYSDPYFGLELNFKF